MPERPIVRTRDLKRNINRALDNVSAEMAQATGKYGRGLATEGYAGGYQAALHDVLAALGGWHPNNSRYWPRPETAPSREGDECLSARTACSSCIATASFTDPEVPRRGVGCWSTVIAFGRIGAAGVPLLTEHMAASC